MAELARYTCPNCNGTIVFPPGADHVACEFCGSTFGINELVVGGGAPSAPVEARQVVQDEAAHAKSVDDFLSRAPWAETAEGLVSHTCSTCGAEVLTDQATATTTCPYCGNVMVESAVLAGNAPELVIPFKVDKARAMALMASHASHKFYLPRAFSADLRHIQGVYVPYYLFSTEVDGWADYDGEIDVGDDDDGGSTTIHRKVHRAAEAEFVRVPVDGSSKMPDGHMDAIEPFNYDELTPFEVGYLAGYLTEVSDESAETCWERGRARCENTFDARLRRNATKHVDRVTRLDHETNIAEPKVETTLIPVWLLHTSWEEHQMLFAVNGQTGRIVGDMPYSHAKRRSTVAVSVLVALALVIGFAFVVTDGDIADFFLNSDNDISTGSIVFSLLAVVLVPFLIDGHFMGQVRTAREATSAGDAMERGMFRITESRG